MYRVGAIGVIAALVAWMPHNTPEGYRSSDTTPVVAVASASDHLFLRDRDWDWRGRIERGKSIEIKGVNGEILAEATSGNQVEVQARLRGRKSDPDEVEMVVLEHENGVTICAVYPSRDRDEPNECRPGRHGRMNVRDNDVSVDFTVRVPAGVGFIGRTVNGEIDALGIEGDVKAHTVNGDVDVTATGPGPSTSPP
jgi:hypothetical protein